MPSKEALLPQRLAPVLHPPLLAICPVLGLYAQNVGVIPPGDLIRPALVLAGGAIGLWLVLWMLMASRYRAGFTATVLVASLVFGWGILEDFISLTLYWLSGWPTPVFYVLFGVLVWGALITYGIRFKPGRRAFVKIVILLAVFFAASFIVADLAMAPVFGRRAAWLIVAYLSSVAIGLGILTRERIDEKTLTHTANWFVGILVVLYAALILLNQPNREIAPPHGLGEMSKAAAHASEIEKPDIYCLFLDGYPRTDTLFRMFGADNRAFVMNLSELEFSLAHSSLANYPTYDLSLASFLNLDYLQNLAPEETGYPPYVLRKLIRENRLFDFVSRQGYEVVAFSPGLALLEPGPPARRIEPAQALTEVELVLLNRTVVGRIMEVVYYFRHDNPAFWQFQSRRDRILHAFDEIKSMAGAPNDSPRFVFAPILLPQPPFLFSVDGGRANPYGPGSKATDRIFKGSTQEFAAMYLGQLQWTNQQLLETVAAIKENSSSPPVILIASGGGPATFSSPDTAGEAIRARYENFVALCNPYEGAAPLPDEVVLANVPRIMLNEVFNLALPMLEPHVYSPAELEPAPE
ncbi:MAG: hypothetical protein KJ052_01990 [Candidatus Hydrogenedentes bacterium]|nr:hypothetical protein [Candidatus Hydrogenedentota bacterium]